MGSGLLSRCSPPSGSKISGIGLYSLSVDGVLKRRIVCRVLEWSCSLSDRVCLPGVVILILRVFVSHLYPVLSECSPVKGSEFRIGDVRVSQTREFQERGYFVDSREKDFFF